MNIKEIYDLAISKGIAADPRGKTFVLRQLKKKQSEFEKLSKEKKKFFDKEELTNPYSDSRIHYVANENLPIKKVLAGIDCDEAEILLADRLGDIDLVLGHHPVGKALADLHSVMDLQVEMLERAGVPIHIAESITQKRMAEVGRSVHAVNDHQPVDIARTLNISYMNIHTITDNLVTNFMEKYINKNKKKIDTVGDIMNLLMEIPEYEQASLLKSPPKVFIGSEKRRPGKIVVTEMTGGTNNAKEMFEQLSRAGVGTILSMHMSEGHKKEAEKHHINVIVAGHMASDSLGMNLFLDELAIKGIEIVPVSGLIRVERFKKTTKKKTTKRKTKKRK